MALGKLQRVDLRTEWANEARDFTSWLVNEENLQELAKTIGDLDLQLIKQEHEVGPYSADILCRDTITQNNVLIENQLEKTDHKHLGQIITYAAGLEAKTVVWIAERFTDQHRAAIDWLNEITNEEVSFFALEIELWRIGNSEAAPKFNVVCSPNDWSKAVAEVSRVSANVTELKKGYLRFWDDFATFVKSRETSPLGTSRKARGQYFVNALGKSGIYLRGNISSQNGQIGADLILSGDEEGSSKERFRKLYAMKEIIESKLGFPLQWLEQPDTLRSKLSIIKSDENVDDPSRWPQQFEWLYDKLERMHVVFKPLVKDL